MGSWFTHSGVGLGFRHRILDSRVLGIWGRVSEAWAFGTAFELQSLMDMGSLLGKKFSALGNTDVYSSSYDDHSFRYGVGKPHPYNQGPATITS